jgi:hypothetical protein
MVAAAKTLAMTALDLLAPPDELRKAKAEFASTAESRALSERPRMARG